MFIWWSIFFYPYLTFLHSADLSNFLETLFSWFLIPHSVLCFTLSLQANSPCLFNNPKICCSSVLPSLLCVYSLPKWPEHFYIFKCWLYFYIPIFIPDLFFGLQTYQLSDWHLRESLTKFNISKIVILISLPNLFPLGSFLTVNIISTHLVALVRNLGVSLDSFIFLNPYLFSF